jgi:hypothetical protein
VSQLSKNPNFFVLPTWSDTHTDLHVSDESSFLLGITDGN